jgi:hypothetical protein
MMAILWKTPGVILCPSNSRVNPKLVRIRFAIRSISGIHAHRMIIQKESLPIYL